MPLNRDAILRTAERLKPVEVQVPEWGGAVLVRGLTGRERDEFETGIVEMRGKRAIFHRENIRARLAAMSIVDEAGRRIFADEDIAQLGELSAAALDRVYTVAAKLSGISDEDLEELSKN